MKFLPTLRILAYKCVLFFFRLLMYAKRLLLWLFQGVVFIVDRLHTAYLHSIAFRVYKVRFWGNKLYQRYRIPLDKRLIETMTKRYTLEVILFGMMFLLMYPYSTLYSQDSFATPGKGTMLYTLLGPADHEYSLDDVVVEELRIAARPIQTPAWKAGAVSTEDAIESQETNNVPIVEVGTISVGSAALTKPSILPGTDPLIPLEEALESNRREVIEYTVQGGDTISGIAQKHGISLATVLWANNLNARSYIRPGQTLKILPVSGVLHTVKSGDTVLRIAQVYKADAEDIVAFNRLKQDGSDIRIGEELMVPDGEKPAPPAPVRRAPVPRTPAATPQRVAAPPALTADGGYIWPSTVRVVTQGYGWRHNGLDISGANAFGTPLFASQSGVVSRSQCNRTGYGCYVMINHDGNAQTLYAHASQLLVTVGEEVVRGQTIALMGSTGNSTGPHIHFEVRVGGRNVNPYQYVK